jgi:hypothetical protein
MLCSVYQPPPQTATWKLDPSFQCKMKTAQHAWEQDWTVFVGALVWPLFLLPDVVRLYDCSSRYRVLVCTLFPSRPMFGVASSSFLV